jgi:hypothetical protein
MAKNKNQKEIIETETVETETIEAELLEYTKNAFLPCDEPDGDSFLEKWAPVMQTVVCEGAAAALNRHLVKEERRVAFESPETLRLELFPSVAGVIPIITAESVADFERMVCNIIYKGADVPNISEMGASFAFGKFNRFIILSNKPYSGVSAERMGLDTETWRGKSMTIRKYHECAHYYTKRFFGSSRNNLHDELIADFCGIYAAFGEYRAEWFLKFLGISKDSDGARGRIKLYVKDLSETAAIVIEKLAVIATDGIEAWSKTKALLRMDEAERIRYLCGKDLLSWEMSRSGSIFSGTAPEKISTLPLTSLLSD